MKSTNKIWRSRLNRWPMKILGCGRNADSTTRPDTAQVVENARPRLAPKGAMHSGRSNPLGKQTPGTEISYPGSGRAAPSFSAPTKPRRQLLLALLACIAMAVLWWMGMEVVDGYGELYEH